MIVLVTTGCLSHAPMSETVMFRDASTTPRHTSTAGIGLTTTSAARKPAPPPETGDARYLRASDADLPRIGTYIALYDSKGAFAMSATGGIFVMGIDATLRLRPSVYLTGAVSPGGEDLLAGQAYLQHRLVNGRTGGLAVAAGYRREVMQTWVDGGLFATDETPFNVVGVRTHGLLRVTDKNNIGLRMSLFGGLTTETREAVVTVSFTAGGF
jgi:hypothetical protein